MISQLRIMKINDEKYREHHFVNSNILPFFIWIEQSLIIFFLYFSFFFNLYAIPYQILTISYQCRQVYGVMLVIFFISFVSSLSEVFLK